MLDAPPTSAVPSGDGVAPDADVDADANAHADGVVDAGAGAAADGLGGWLDPRALAEALAEALALGGGELAFCIAAVFVAGVVRGFSGFALSALIMASVAVIVPPVSLIPVCYVLEGVSSVLMFRGGARAADWHVVRGLAIGSAIGVPIGLQATLHLPADASRLVTLVLITTLATLQLAGRSPAFLATRAGLYGSGLTAGVATGLASVGGMVVALYVLASRASPVRMRASLVMFLFIGMFTTGTWLLAAGVLDRLALARGLAFTPVVVLGVLLGTWLFRPSLQGFYRRFCLTLLIGLALAGLGRLALAR